MQRSILILTLSLLLCPTINLNVEAQSMKEDLKKEGLGTYCATDIVRKKRMNNASPEMARKMKRAQERLEARYEERKEGKRAGTVYTVPVVFHVIHDNGPEKIDPDRVENAMDILNRDFRKRNGDTSQLVTPFKSIAADIEIEFRLAQKDPDGNCHRGITYTRSDLTYDGDDQMKKLIQWDPSSYMNVWICNDINIGAGAAGYTTPPPQAALNPGEDGIVLKYNYLGTQSPSSVFRSRTLTHEAGHYFNLDHPWGTCGNPGDGSNCDGSNCNGQTCNNGYGSTDDGLCDTPHTVGWTSCNTSGSSCGSKDNVQNYMEYSYCHRMFTQDQRSAMRNAITAFTAERNQLWKSANLQETGVATGDNLCAAAFNADERVICKGESIQFSDLSYHGATSWTWEFKGGNSSNNTAQNPSATYPDSGSYDVTLTVSDGNKTVKTTKEDFITVLPSPGLELAWIENFDYRSYLENNSKYIRQNPSGDQVKWKVSTQAGAGGSNASVKLKNADNSGGELDAFSTSTMDASNVPAGNLELAFDVAFAQANSGDQDELIIYASPNCGKSWSQRGSYTGTQLASAPPQTQNFTPNEDDWERKVINASLTGSYNVSELRFKFEFISDGGNNIYIDNINVRNQENVGVQKEKQEEAALRLHPNPVREQSVLSLELPRRDQVSIDLMDLRGKKVREIRSGGFMDPGSHRMKLNTADLEAGPYFLQVRIGKRESTKKLFKK